MCLILLANTRFGGIYLNTERIIDPNKPMVALTFDDGPSSYYTPIILDILRAHNSVATFFVLGVQAEQKPDVLNLILEAGNQIGIHSYNHPDLTMLPLEEAKNQLERTIKIVEDATGYTPTIMRPPYGRRNEELVNNINLPVIIWSVDTYDWSNRDPEIIYNNIFENIQDGDIILMHDIYETSAEAVKTIVPELINRGFQLLTIEELSQYKGIPLEPSKEYHHFS